MFIDSHSHFDSCIDHGYTEDELLSLMKEHNIGYAVQIATDIDNFKWSRDFSRKHDNIYYSIGIHPSSEYMLEDISVMDGLLEDSVSEGDRIFGVGEIGLDYHWMTYEKEKQIELFEAQIELSHKYSLPIIVHNRDAAEDTYYVLKGMNCTNVIIHCFSGDRDIVKKFLDMGCYISFAGNVTFKKAIELKEALAYTPTDRLLFETDCPYLTPEPKRGKTNHPDYVRFIYEFASQYRGEDIEKLQDTVYNNFRSICPFFEE